MNNICDKCNVIDYIEHFFYTCKKVNQIWDEVNNILFQKYNDTIRISVTDVLFGFKHEDKLRCIEINKIMGVGKCVLVRSDMENIQILLVYYIQSFR